MGDRSLVANRALAPSSKLAATSWVAHDVHIPGLDAVSDDACYRAMDWLLAVEDKLARGVFDQVAHLLNLEVDLIFFDTTSTYFETEDPDEPVWRDEHGRRVEGVEGDSADQRAGDTAGEPPAGAAARAGFRSYGKSKDSRDDLPQVVVGMAVTRDGIPVRVWCWPGNTSDSPLIRQVKDDLRDWTLGKVIWVADRGFTSAANRRHLAAGAGGYILGEKLRSGSTEAVAAMARQGRYQDVTANLRVKEVKISDTERFVVCHNPDAADHDAKVRANLVDRLEAMIAASDRLSPTRRAELRGVISTKPGLNRFLRVTPGGLLRTRRRKITADAKLDGKYLLRTSDPHLSTEDIALGYKQLLEVERGGGMGVLDLLGLEGGIAARVWGRSVGPTTPPFSAGAGRIQLDFLSSLGLFFYAFEMPATAPSGQLQLPSPLWQLLPAAPAPLIKADCPWRPHNLMATINTHSQPGGSVPLTQLGAR